MSTVSSPLKRKLDKIKAYKMGKANRTHGLTNSLTWKTWDSMLQRCHNPKAPDYKYYGAKGIKVFYTSIVELVNDIGLRPSINHSIDRIDHLGHYTPGNCEWVTKSENTKREMKHRALRRRGRGIE